MTSTDAGQTSAAARLARLREALKAAGCSARVITLAADERAERISDYALEG